jgi:DNA-binding CsgD family transcriptional regulator/tetratricopeptide (TPR) repeat protein
MARRAPVADTDVRVAVEGQAAESLESTLGLLTENACRLLEVGAVLGASFSADDAADVLGESIGWVLTSLHETLDSGLLALGADDLVFGDDTVRRAIYEGIPVQTRLALHRQVGGLLLDRGGAALPAAAHLLKGTSQGDRKALAVLDRAAGELLSSSPQTAAELALRALTLTGDGDRNRFCRTVTAVGDLVTAGHLADAAELAGAALQGGGWTVACDAELGVTLSSILLMAGRPADALAEAEAVLVEPGLAGHLYSAAELVRLFGLVSLGDFERARERAGAILAGSVPYADAALSGAVTVLALIAWDEGRIVDALGLLRAAMRRNDVGSMHDASAYRPRLAAAAILTAIGEFDEAAEMISATRTVIELTDDTVWVPAPAVRLAHLHLAAGRLGDAVAEADSALAAAEELGAHSFAASAESVLVCVALLRGDLGDAARHVERLRAERPAEAATLGTADLAWIEVRLADAQDNPSRTLEVLARLCDDVFGHKRLFVEEPAAAAWLVRAALAHGDPGRAQRVVRCAELLAFDNGQCSSVQAAAAHARALLDRDPAALERAAATHRQPWAQASAAEDAGVMLVDRGDLKGARVQLERAGAGYARMGADRDAGRIRSRLGKLGRRRRPSRRADRPVSGWASLTQTERNVADLVATGLTNQQVAEHMFLSRHTVDFHLRQIFRGLGIGSRVDLTRLTFERDQRDR